MTAYKRGDVVLVPFPFSNQTATKKRPAIIISSDAYLEIYNGVEQKLTKWRINSMTSLLPPPYLEYGSLLSVLMAFTNSFLSKQHGLLF